MPSMDRQRKVDKRIQPETHGEDLHGACFGLSVGFLDSLESN